MDNQSTSVGYIILGAFLALVTSLIVEGCKYLFQTRNNRKDSCITLKLELKGIIDSIDRLVENFGQKQFFPFPILNELFSKIQRLDKIRDRVVYIKNDLKKEEILSLFNEINIFYSDTLTLEQSAFTPPNNIVQGEAMPWHHEVYKSQRQMSAIKSVDLKRKIQDIILSLK